MCIRDRGKVSYTDNCEIQTPELDSEDIVLESDLNDWLVYYSDLWLPFQEVGVIDHEEMKQSFCVEMTWDGLRCSECGKSVAGIYERMCNSDCTAIETVIDWVYDNIEESDEVIDMALYSGSLYQGGDPEPSVEQPKLFDTSQKTKKKTSKSKKKKSTSKSK